MVLILLANGFEEIEALSPADILSRAGADVKLVGISGEIVEGRSGISVRSDISIKKAIEYIEKGKKIDMIVLPGGMPGTVNLDSHPDIDRIIRQVSDVGGFLAAICAAPRILGKRGYLKGKKATCYPGNEKYLLGAECINEGVVDAGNIITGRAAGSAVEFGLKLVEKLYGIDRAEQVRQDIIYEG